MKKADRKVLHDTPPLEIYMQLSKTETQSFTIQRIFCKMQS